MDAPSQKSRSAKPKPQEPGPGEARSEKPSGRRVESSDVQERLEAAYREFVRNLQQAQVDAQRGGWERYRNYVRAHQEAQLDAQTRAAEAYQSFLQTLYEWQGEENAEQQGWEEVYRKYADTLQQVQEEARQRVGEAWQAFSTSGQEGGSAFEQAYRKYLESLRDLWSGLDPATVDPGTLAAMAQALNAVAWSAQGAAGSGR